MRGPARSSLGRSARRERPECRAHSGSSGHDGAAAQGRCALAAAKIETGERRSVPPVGDSVASQWPASWREISSCATRGVDVSVRGVESSVTGLTGTGLGSHRVRTQRDLAAGPLPRWRTRVQVTRDSHPQMSSSTPQRSSSSSQRPVASCTQRKVGEACRSQPKRIMSVSVMLRSLDRPCDT